MLLTAQLLFLSNPRTIIFIIFILVLFFGAKRIPELFRGVGQGVREFKDATNAEPQQPANPNQQHYNPNGYPQQYGQAPQYSQNGQPQQPQQYNPNGYPQQPQQYGAGQVPPAPYNPNTPAS